MLPDAEWTEGGGSCDGEYFNGITSTFQSIDAGALYVRWRRRFGLIRINNDTDKIGMRVTFVADPAHVSAVLYDWQAAHRTVLLPAVRQYGQR